MTCNTCKANMVCDHDIYGFETCDNYIPNDVVKNEELIDKIATFFEREENWGALKNCWIYSGRSEDLRKLLRQALQG